jgi:DNA-binding LacI/PurR family transcriptional regulator
MAKITLHDIAKICGVDISTVSRAMRADPRVKAATRKRIKETADRLNYRPNLLARNLAGGKSRTLWVIMPSLDASTDYRIVRHASHHANEQDYSLFAALHDCDNFGQLEGHSEAHYEQMLEQAAQGLTDGAIILPRRHVNDVYMLDELTRQNFPMVFVDNFIEELPVPVVTTENRKAAQELAQRCADAGATSAICLFREPNPVARTRKDFAQQAFQKNNIPSINLMEIPAHWNPDHLTDTVAIVGSSQFYVHHFAVQQAELLQGRRLIFGVFDEWTGEPSPAEKVIIAIQDCEAIADRAVERLIDIIEDRPSGKPRIEMVPIKEFKCLSSSFVPT